MCEFQCVDCGRHVVAVCAEKAPEPPLCGHCMFIPGWHEDPALVAILDPEYQANG